MSNHNSYARRKNKSPAYYITEYGLLKEIDQHLEGTHALYWKPEPLSEERLLELKKESKTPLEFARLIEEEMFR